MKQIITLFIFIGFLHFTSPAQKVETELSEYWHNGTWIKSQQNTYGYDENCFMIHMFSQRWDTASASWKNIYLGDRTNNNLGSMVQDIYQSWDINSASWLYSNKQTMSYTSTNKFHASEFFVYANGNWVWDAKHYFIYNNNDLLEEFGGQSYDTTTATWTWGSRARYEYNSNGLRTIAYSDSWDETSSSWLVYQQSFNHYNSQNKNDTTTTQLNWYGPWENYSRTILDYDNAGRMITTVSQQWDTASNVWINHYQGNYGFNADGTMNYLLSKYWNAATASWENSSRTTFTYNNCNASARESGLVSNIFPNPVGARLNLALSGTGNAKYCITDLNGKIVASGAFSGSDADINVGNLKPNLYFIILERENGKTVNQFIKQ